MSTRTLPALGQGLRRPLAVLAAVGAVLLAVPAVAFAGDTGPSRLDGSVQQLVDKSPAGLWNLAHALDWLGEPTGRAVLTIALAAVCLVAGRRMLAIAAVAAMVAATLLSTVLKYVVDRRIHDGSLSYPSGHVAAVTVAATIIGLLLADLLRTTSVRGTAVVPAVSVLGGGLMAWGQILLTAHYPTDALGGYGCGLLVTAGAVLLMPRRG
ncbi:phosphatase PAP2 family protein [Kribbella sp. NPDC059898]|uniref:phosphatase PAP2 family protein n=1 Tax=Kribbella sp. NPDC059898 TaxID=3346995 RepID=UPI00366825A0